MFHREKSVVMPVRHKDLLAADRTQAAREGEKANE